MSGGLIPLSSGGKASKGTKDSDDFDFDRDQLSASDKEDGGFGAALDDMFDKPTTSRGECLWGMSAMMCCRAHMLLVSAISYGLLTTCYVHAQPR